MNSENTSFNIRNSPWLAYAAMACCIPAAALFMFFFLSIPLAALAIIFALISRGNDSLRGQARLAVITASVTIAVSSWYCHTQIQTFVTRTLPDVALEYMQKNYPDYYNLLTSGDNLFDLILPGTGSQNPDPYYSTITDGGDFV